MCERLEGVIEYLPGINEGFLEKGKKVVIRRENNILARRLPSQVTPTIATPLTAERMFKVRYISMWRLSQK